MEYSKRKIKSNGDKASPIFTQISASEMHHASVYVAYRRYLSKPKVILVTVSISVCELISAALNGL